MKLVIKSEQRELILMRKELEKIDRQIEKLDDSWVSSANPERIEREVAKLEKKRDELYNKFKKLRGY